MGAKLMRLALALFAVIAVCAVCAVAVSPARCAEADGDVVTILIYSTGDFHDHTGNLARIAGFVKAERKKHRHVLFVDAGDFWNKGEGWVKAARGEPMVALMTAMGYDAIILGNHDYIYGKDRVLDLKAKYPDWPLLLCNMRWEEKDKERAKGIPQHRIHDFHGVKLCLSGGGSHYRNHAHGPAFPMYHERDGYKVLLPKITGKAQVYVFVSHLYDHSDRNLINAWGKDAPHVMIGGHTHAQRAWMQKDTLIVKAGFHGGWLGRTVIRYNKAEKKIVERSARILKVRGDWPEDEAVKELRTKLMARGKED
jgi:2',3'-cyclic-nucleotide 2'-phosphodiesterase (5'-nucleotidase family)